MLIKLFTNFRFLLAITAIAAFLRFFQLGANPPSLDWDEASMGYNAYSILKTGRDEYGNKFPISFRSFDDYKPPVYVYLTVPAIAAFGLNEYSVRLPAAIIGVIGVYAVYFLVLEILPKWPESRKQWIALSSSFFFAISPWHLQFSRAAFEANIGNVFLILSILFFFKATKKGIYYLLFAFFLTLSIYSYHSFRLIDPLLLAILCLFFYKELLKQKLIVGLSMAFIILSALPVYINVNNLQQTGARFSMVTIFSDPKLQQLSAEQVLLAKKNNDIVREILYNRRFIFIPKMISGYTDHFNFDFLFLHGDGGLQHHAYNMGMLYLWDFPFILIGAVYFLKKRDKHIYILFLIFLLAPLPSSIASGTPHPVRAIAMIPAFQIFAAAGFVWTFLYLRKKRNFGKIFLLGIIILFVYNVFYYLNSYFIKTPIYYGYYWQYGNKEAILYAKSHEREYKHIIMTYEYDQPYIYYLFYNKIDPAWYQKNWDYNRNGIVDRFYRKIGKYEFTKITREHLSLKKTLLIGAPSEIPSGTGQIKKEIYFPDGRIAYKIVKL